MAEHCEYIAYIVSTRPFPEKACGDRVFFDPDGARGFCRELNYYYEKDIYTVYEITMKVIKEING